MLFWTVPLATQVIRDGPQSHIVEIAAWTLVVLIVVPTLVGAALALLADVRSPRWLHRLLSRVGLSSSTRMAEAWNWVFSRRLPAYVRVRLSDGRMILGWYGGRSFASSDPSLRDLYLEEQWVADEGRFREPYPSTRGVWLNGSEIVSVEFFGGSPSTDDS